MAEPVMQCHSKDSPINLFTGDSVEFHFDDWIPALERAATWNNWTENKTLSQLASHLQGRALHA